MPEDWIIFKSKIFYNLMPIVQDFPVQGWKIHVSATISNSESILRKVIPVCVSFNTPLKFVCDKYLIGLSSEKGWPRGSSGKYITIYPRNISTFKSLLQKLYSELIMFEGPYILSDKRYRDCKVLYYRYGGLKPNFYVDYDGNLIPYLESPDGNKVPDFRHPYYYTPEWVKDPFEDDVEDETGNQGLKNGRYEALSVLKFANNGGIYLGYDNETQRKVVIKEARPYTLMNKSNNLDSIQLRKREWEILKILKDTGLTPKPIDLFIEWEHLFLVESYIPEITLQQYIAKNNPIYKIKPTEDELKKYYKNIIQIGINLTESLQVIHDHNVILGDFSYNNVFVHSDLSVSFPDLEGSYSQLLGGEVANQYTPGFFDIESIKEKGLTFEHDYYALGCVLCSLLTPQFFQSQINQNAPKVFLEELMKDYDAPRDFISIIISLMDKKIDQRPSLSKVLEVLKGIEITTPKISINNSKQEFLSDDKLKKTIKGISKYIIETATPEREDRLFPAAPNMVNPLNISHGAVGVTVALKQLNGEVPYKFIKWIMDKKVSEKNYPPGLYLGLSGIAWGLTLLNEIDYGIKILKKASKHQMLYKSPDIYTGIAGFGLTNLHFWNITKEQQYLDTAIKVANRLFEIRQRNEKGSFWYAPDKTVYIGYPRGASGISVFLLYLYQITKEKDFLDLGKDALNFDLNNSFRNVPSFPESTSNTKIALPYWFKGTAGVATATLRYAASTGENYYKNKLDLILTDVFKKYTFNPGLFNGLAGLGNTLIDAYQFLGDESYLHKAHQIGRGIYLFEIETEKGISFPGDFVLRKSNDFGTGASGIGLFLHRLCYKGQNFNYLIDNLISSPVDNPSNNGPIRFQTKERV